MNQYRNNQQNNQQNKQDKSKNQKLTGRYIKEGITNRIGHFARHGICMGSCLAILVGGPLMGDSGNSVAVSGHFLGIRSHLEQKSASNAQFDYAANIDLEFQLSPSLTGIVQLQGGAGHGDLAFVGPGTEVTDINIVYSPQIAKVEKSVAGNTLENPWKNWEYRLTMGSFDTPFGEETGRLSNNADTMRNPFILNSLLYSGLVGGSPVGTLNTLGIMAEVPVGRTQITAALTNGTGENAASQGNGTAGVLSVGTMLHSKLRVVVSGLTSDDTQDQENESSNSLSAKLDAYLLEAVFEVRPGIDIHTYFGELAYSGGRRTEVSVWMAEYKQKITEPLYVAARVSSWTPSDRSGDGVGINPAVPIPGLAQAGGTFSPVNDTALTRYQLGVGMNLSDNVMVKCEWFTDRADAKKKGAAQTVSGVIFAVNGQF